MKHCFNMKQLQQDSTYCLKGLYDFTIEKKITQ